MNKLVLTPAHAAFLADTIARNRARFAGWSMEGEGADAAAQAAAAKAASDKAAADAAAAAAAAASGNATDADGKDLGFPKDTPVAEMNDKQEAAYWRYHAKKHEGRYKGLLGDRTPEEVKADLEAAAAAKKAQMTPSEQAIAEAKEAGKKEAQSEERKTTATALFRVALEANGITGDDLDELVANFNVAGYIGDTGVDTTKITNFAKRFGTSGTDTSQQRNRQRDFGGGNRGGGGGASERGAGGKAEAQKRFGNKK